MQPYSTRPKSDYIPTKEGRGVKLKSFSDEPKQHNGKGIYYFQYSYKDPKTLKYRYSQITSGQKEYRQAKARRDELKELVESTLNYEGVRQTDLQPIGEFVESFVIAKEQEKKSKKTLYDYRHCLAAFTKFTDPATPLCNITRDLCRRFFATFNSPSNRDLHFRVLRAAFNFAVMEEKLEKSPLHKMKLNSSEPIRDFFTDNEFIRLYEGMSEDTYLQRTAKNATLLAFATGARYGEICNLQIKKIRWERKEIVIANSENFQTKNKCERIIPITPRVAQAVKNQMQNKASHKAVRESSLLFPNEADKPYGNKLSRLFREHRCEVMPDREGIHFHSLRHSYGQNAYNAGVPVVEISKLMGHRSVAITMKYYARQADYKNLSAMYEHLENQPVIESPKPIRGAILTNQLEECVHLVTTT